VFLVCNGVVSGFCGVMVGGVVCGLELGGGCLGRGGRGGGCVGFLGGVCGGLLVVCLLGGGVDIGGGNLLVCLGGGGVGCVVLWGGGGVWGGGRVWRGGWGWSFWGRCDFFCVFGCLGGGGCWFVVCCCGCVGGGGVGFGGGVFCVGGGGVLGPRVVP